MKTISIFLLGALILAASFAAAQTASIVGTVSDPTGAVVSGAAITIQNTETGAVRTVVSGDTGVYSVTNLEVGKYQIEVKKQNFATSKMSSITLTVDQTLTANVTLKPGAVTEEVNVSAASLPPVDVESSQISNVVDSQKMKDLPLLTRDPYSLILLSPGTIQSNSGLGGFSVNGSRERDNNFLLDGADNNDTSVPGIAGGLASLNPDATEEFRVITNNFMPEYGRNNGAIIDVVTKSGTNKFHGGARWFGRWNALGARDYFNPGIDQSGNPSKQNPYVRNQFGFNFGGPIIKNKTFFFFDTEWQRFRTTVTNTAVVPNAGFKAALTGATFNYADPVGSECPGGTPGCIYAINLSGANNALALPFDPLITQILGLYTNPNATAVDSLRGNLNYGSSSKQDVRNITAKFDHHITDKEVLTVHGAYDAFQDPDAFHDEFLPGIGATASQSHVTLMGASLTSTLASTLLNEARFGFNRNDSPFNCGTLNIINSFGATDQYGRSRDFSLPDIAGFGCLPLGDSNGQSRRTGTWSWGDTLTWVKAGHTLKFGADFRRVYEDGFDSFSSRDTVTFNGFSNFGQAFVDLDPSNPCALGGPCGDSILQNMASMLYGIMDTESQSQFFNKSGARTRDDARKFRQHEYDFFGQDSWKIRSNLTLNFGLRYQFNGVPFEVNNNLSNLFQNASGPAPALAGGGTGFTFQIVGPGTGHLLYNNDYSNLEPRVGFAWDPFKDGKTSVRGAFGTFHDRVFGNLFGNARGNPPFQESPFNIPFSTPEATALPGTVPASPVIADGSGFFPVIIAQHYPLPYTVSWNFGVQRELLRDVTLDINYVGNRGFHLLRVVDGNPPQPALVAANIANGAPPSLEQFTNLWFGGPGLQATNNNAFFQAALNESNGNSWYHALQMNVTKRFARGLQIQGAYTYSHSIDDAPDPLVASEKTNRTFPRNSFALFNEFGNSGFDIRQRLVVNYAWELPFGRGRKYLNSGIGDEVLGGWQLSGITTLQSGHPYDVFGNRDSEHTGLSARLDLIGNPALPSGHPKTETGANPAAFAMAPFGRAGNVGKNKFFGPGYNNWDMVMSKDIRITERVQLQFRSEFYNVFNRVQFDQPDNLFQDTGTFGFSTATISRSDATTSARQLQFGLKLNF
jgi:hypothetical protein